MLRAVPRCGSGARLKMCGEILTGQDFPWFHAAPWRNFGAAVVVAEWDAVPGGAALSETLQAAA